MFTKLVNLLRAKANKNVFSASPRMVKLLQEEGYLNISEEYGTSERPVYVFTWKNRNFYFKKMEEDCFVLSREDIFTKHLDHFDKFSTVQGRWNVINLNQKFGVFDSSIILKSDPKEPVKEEEPKLEKWDAEKKDQLPFPSRDAFSKELEKAEEEQKEKKVESLEGDENHLNYQLDYKEREVDLSDVLKEEKERKQSDFKWKSNFQSEADVFSSVNFVSSGDVSASSSGGEGDDEVGKKYTEEIKTEVKQGTKVPKDISEMIPSPVDGYKQMMSSLSPDKRRASLFNPNFPISEVKELNNNHHFWTLISPKYNDVDSFVLKLKNFYNSLTPHELDQLCARVTPEKNALIWNKTHKKVELGRYQNKDSSFKKLLEEKLNRLREKNKELSSYLDILRGKLRVEGRHPDSDSLYIYSQKEQDDILHEIEGTEKVLRTFEEQINKFSGAHPDFSPQFYLSIFGSQSMLFKNDAEVGEAVVDLNNQLNEIIFYQKEIEKVLLDKLNTLHRAKKSEMKLEFLAQEASLSKLITRRLQAEESEKKKEHLKQLEIQGSLQLSKANVQKRINLERTKLVNYLEDLNRMDNIPNYEEESRKLKEQKEIFNQKVEEYREHVYSLKLKVESVEKQYSAFLGSIRDQIVEFQQEISNSYKSHVGLLNDSMNLIWTDWTNQGIDYIERILSRKKQLVREFSEIIILKLKHMYASQDNLLEESRKRKDEWEKVYREMVDEFKTLGYYLSQPKPSEYFHKYLPKMDKSHFNLSPEMKKLIYYRPELKYTTPKVNELIGLSPKVLNDEEFLIIDQVWTHLTPVQEQKLKDKLSKESRERDMQKVEKLLKRAQEDMQKRLQDKQYSFRSLTFETDFPQEADEEASFRRLKSFEKAQFHSWKETHFTSSEVRYKFKDMLTQFAKRLFTLKGVENWGNRLNITDSGDLQDPEQVEKLSELDYFMKSKEKLSLVESCSSTSFKIDESELYDIEDEGYLSILEALEEREADFDRKRLQPVKKPALPSLEEWSKLNFKRYREEKNKIDIHDIKDGLSSLEKEIQSLQKASGSYKQACEFERAKREMISAEMQLELKGLKEYLEERERELSQIFSETSDTIDSSFEELGKRLDERKKSLEESRASSYIPK